MEIKTGEIMQMEPILDGFFKLRKGFLRVLRLGPDSEKEVFLAHLWPGDYFPRTMFDELDDYTSVVEGMIDSEVEIVNPSPQVLRDVLRSYDGFMSQMSQHAYNMRHYGAEQRILNHLLYLTTSPIATLQEDGTCAIKIVQEDLAREVGILRATVNRTCKLLQEAGVLRRGFGEILVHIQVFKESDILE